MPSRLDTHLTLVKRVIDVEFNRVRHDISNFDPQKDGATTRERALR
jgi:hypothetical protein